MFCPKDGSPNRDHPRDLLGKCGNKVCEAGETCKSCPADCGTCPVADQGVNCVCCYALGQILEGKSSLQLRPANGCTVPGTALEAAGLPASRIPPPLCL